MWTHRLWVQTRQGPRTERGKKILGPIRNWPRSYLKWIPAVKKKPFVFLSGAITEHTKHMPLSHSQKYLANIKWTPCFCRLFVVVVIVVLNVCIWGFLFWCFLFHLLLFVCFNFCCYGLTFGERERERKRERERERERERDLCGRKMDRI